MRITGRLPAGLRSVTLHGLTEQQAEEVTQQAFLDGHDVETERDVAWDPLDWDVNSDNGGD